MPKINEAPMRELRMKYKIAHETYANYVKRLIQAESTDKPSAELLEQETKAARELTETRAKLLAANDAALASKGGGSSTSLWPSAHQTFKYERRKRRGSQNQTREASRCLCA